MKISVIRPCAIVTAQDGSMTRRLKVGEQVEFSTEWEIKGAQALVKGGMAIEVGGNAEPSETKSKPKRTRKVAKGD